MTKLIEYTILRVLLLATPVSNDMPHIIWEKIFIASCHKHKTPLFAPRNAPYTTNPNTKNTSIMHKQRFSLGSTRQQTKLPKQDSIRRSIATWLIRVIMPANFNTEEEIKTINMEDITMLAETVKEWPKQWLHEGIEKGIIKVARNLFKKNHSLKEIAELTDLSLEELKRIFSTDEPNVQEKPAKYSGKARPKKRIKKK